MATLSYSNGKLTRMLKSNSYNYNGIIVTDFYITIPVNSPTFNRRNNGKIVIITYRDSNNREQTLRLTDRSIAGDAFASRRVTGGTRFYGRFFIRPSEVYVFNTMTKIKFDFHTGDDYEIDIIESRYVTNSTESAFATSTFEEYFAGVTPNVSLSHVVSSLYKLQTIITNNPGAIRLSIKSISGFITDTPSDYPIPLNAGTTEQTYSGNIFSIPGLKAEFSMQLYPTIVFARKIQVQYSGSTVDPVIPTVPDIKTSKYNVVINGITQNTAKTEINVEVSFTPRFPPSDFVEFTLHLSPIKNLASLESDSFTTFATDNIYTTTKPAVGAYFLYAVLKHNTDQLSVSTFYIVDIGIDTVSIREASSLHLLMYDARFFVVKALHNSIEVLITHDLLLDARCEEIRLQTFDGQNVHSKTAIIGHEYNHIKVTLTDLPADYVYIIKVQMVIQGTRGLIGEFTASTIKNVTSTSDTQRNVYNLDALLSQTLDTEKYEFVKRYSTANKQKLAEDILADTGTLILMPNGLDRNVSNNGRGKWANRGVNSFGKENQTLILDRNATGYSMIPDINMDNDLIIEVGN